MWYQRRIQDGGWIEEVWYSHYMIGVCYCELTKTDTENAQDHAANMMYWLTKAFDKAPHRAETIMALATYHRLNGMYSAAYMYAKTAADPYMQRGLSDTLFIEISAHTYLPLYEMSISAFYINRHKEGLDACRKLLAMNDLPEYIRISTLKNIKFYESAQ